MSLARFARGSAVLAIGAAIAVSGWQVYAQSAAQPTNDAPNPYQTIEDHFKLPEGRTWGSTSAVDISPDGRFIWVAERCGTNSCLDRATGQMSKLPTVLKFDQSGKLVASFGGGMHGLPARHPRRSPGQRLGDRRQRQRARRRRAVAAARGAAGAPGGGRGPAPTAPPAGATIGHQVFKFSPEGKLLMTIGKAGGATGPTECCWQPNDVITNQKGEIFISEGHGANPNDRILKYTPGRQVDQGHSASAAAVRENSTARTRSRSTPRDACSSAIAATTGRRSSIRKASSSPTGRSSAGRAACSSIATTCCTRPTPSRAR